ncbi:unnamed protein product [Paramecium octaurelia]|uniref:Uncharacterized protein n=1 Tax=Paramecium octaurelia TaxID=43137 RepID=A0A8S1X6W6_PAROT|nr:unnamed protein product [Paramecium octaurelia]
MICNDKTLPLQLDSTKQVEYIQLITCQSNSLSNLNTKINNMIQITLVYNLQSYSHTKHILEITEQSQINQCKQIESNSFFQKRKENLKFCKGKGYQNFVNCNNKLQ